MSVLLLEEVAEHDDNDLLYSAAERVAIRDLVLEEGLLKKKYDPALHPRWPKGTARAGQFMKKGQWFEADGKTWQVINASGGHIEAVEASGEAEKVEHRI